MVFVIYATVSLAEHSQLKVGDSIFVFDQRLILFSPRLLDAL